MSEHRVEDLTNELTALGVEAGNVLMVHASLRRLGPVVGRADGVIDALVGAIGPDGTLVMMIAADDDAGPFDAGSTPADPEIGVLAEVFRRRTGVVVGDHAAARFAALGPLAEELTSDPPLHDYYDRGSPLERICDAGGVVLRLGADPDTVTMTHYAEYLAGVPAKRRVTRTYVRADVGEQRIDSLDDSDGIAVWPHGDYFPQILLDFVAEGRASVGPVGSCAAELLEARAFVDYAARWMEKQLAAD